MAFKGTPTGIPFPRIHLGWRSVETLGREDSCLAGAGTLLLEMGTLSLLLQDPQYATLARNVVLRLWNYRSPDTGLLGTDINIYTGEWINSMSGVGAGQDSFYEYLLKSGILFDDSELIQMFEESLRNLRRRLCGASSVHHCACPEGHPPVYWNTDMFTGEVVNTWVDTLQSVWPGILTLAGELRDAKCQHELHLSIWRRFGLPPERFNLLLNKSELAFYPLRPEFAESTYYLYRATKDPVYLQIGAMIVNNLDHYTRAKCGFATIHNVEDMTQEDRMESFFLSETLKYLYLLFDESHPLNVHEEDYLFTTQGHILPISHLRKFAKNLPNSPFKNAQFTNHSPLCEPNGWEKFW
uniref:alpha-1,2-Mannosidase n=1 Tax=Echinococcus granulosus TaxID=6210 RepID=A0A068WGI5_ECHGR|nr:er degradation enhancer mannosidase alpha [Echinococcus granulosus]